MLNSSVTGFCFNSKLRKSSEDLFFGLHEGKLDTSAKICVAVLLETLREDPTIRIRDKLAAWKLHSKISRTALLLCIANYKTLNSSVVSGTLVQMSQVIIAAICGDC